MIIKIKYSELYKQVLGLILIPLIFSGVFIAVILLLAKITISDTIMDIVILAGSFLLIGGGIVVVLKVIYVNGEMEYDARGIHFHLYKRTFLFPHDDFFINYSNIENAAISQDAQERVFATIKLRSPKKSLIISPEVEGKKEALIIYWDEVEKKIASYNTSIPEHPELIIKSKGFYEGNAIKVLAFISFVFAGFFTVLKIVDPALMSTWKLIAYYCYSLPFIFTVIKSNRRKIDKAKEANEE